MNSAHPSVVGRILRPFAHAAIEPRWFTALACTMVLVQGCATSEVNGITPGRLSWPVGTVTTKDDRPLVLSAPDQTIQIVTGAMKLTPVPPSVWYLPDWSPDRRRLPAEFLDIENRGSRLRIKLHAGELTVKGLQIVGATHGLSTNIVGDWQDQLLNSREYSETKSCTKHCTREVEHETCDKGTCKKERVTETYDCGTGSYTAKYRESQFLRHYEVQFRDTQKSTDTLAQFKAKDPYEVTDSLGSTACQ